MQRAENPGAGRALAFTARVAPAAVAAIAAVALVASRPAVADEAVQQRAAIQQFGRAVANGDSRNEDSWKVTWPGVAWRTAFNGTSIAVIVQDAFSGYRVRIDGKDVSAIKPAELPQIVWYRELAAGPHQIEVVRQNATRRGAGEFMGFRLDEGGSWLPAQAPPARQIEFLGDSWSTGYGNLSSGVQCADDAIPALSDATQGYAIVTARTLHADWQLNAIDGIGIARNWHGIWKELDYASYYDLALETEPTSHYEPGAAWHPQVVVIWLGANDFVAPLAAEENWTPSTLDTAFERNWRALLAQVRRRIGAQGLIVVMQPAADANPANSRVPRLVGALQLQGERNLVYLELPKHLQRTACDGHPSVADGRLISAQLVQAIRQRIRLPP